MSVLSNPGVALSSIGAGAGGSRALGWSIHVDDGVAVIAVTGELDAGTAPPLDDRVWPLAGSGRQLIVDLAGLDFCGCAGLAMFLRWQARAHDAGGSLYLAAVPGPVRRVITVVGLQDQLPSVPAPRGDTGLAPEVITGTVPTSPGNEAGNGSPAMR